MTTGSGTYFDGAAPLPQPVKATLDSTGLLISGTGGVTVARWRIEEIDIADRRPASLTLARRGGEARLRVNDAELARRLINQLKPRLGRRTRRHAVGWIGAGAALVAALGLFLVFAWPLTADLLARFIPEAWFDRLGDSAAAAVIGRQPVCTDAEARAMLDGMAARLGRASGREPPRITVIKTKQSNAFALPGNRVIVLSGLLAEAEHPNEIAGVLAHEIGHLEHAHPTRQFVRQAGLFLLIEMFTGGSSLGAFGASAVATGYSREFEREADSFAESAMAAAGLDARPVAGFFARLAAKEKSGPGILGVVGNYLSTHPDSAERAEVFARSKPGSAALTADRFAALKKACAV
jgi:Zn-dependent protease with chaperone function